MNIGTSLGILKEWPTRAYGSAIPEAEIEEYRSVLQYFSKSSDERCIPLFINSVARGRWDIDIYDDIGEILCAYPINTVVPYLKQGLASKDDNIVISCIYWAIEVEVKDLVDDIFYLYNNHENVEVWEDGSDYLHVYEDSFSS